MDITKTISRLMVVFGSLTLPFLVLYTSEKVISPEPQLLGIAFLALLGMAPGFLYSSFTFFFYEDGKTGETVSIMGFPFPAITETTEPNQDALGFRRRNRWYCRLLNYLYFVFLVPSIYIFLLQNSISQPITIIFIFIYAGLFIVPALNFERLLDEWQHFR